MNCFRSSQTNRFTHHPFPWHLPPNDLVRLHGDDGLRLHVDLERGHGRHDGSHHRRVRVGPTQLRG